MPQNSSKNSSVLWRHAKKILIKKVPHIKCDHCGKTFVYADSSTSGPLRHLKRQHTTLMTEEENGY